MGKIRGGESLTEVPKIIHYGFRDWGCSRCNITTVRACPVLKKVYSD